MATLKEILDIEFNSKRTYLENVEFQTLLLMFNQLKSELNSVFDPSCNEFTDSTSVYFAQDICQEIHNRVCKHFDIKPTIVNVIPNDFYVKILEKRIEGGNYSFKNREIELGLLVNIKKEYQTYDFNYLSDAWSSYELSSLLHETYHHIQIEMLKKYINGEKLPKRFENEIKMLEIYFDSERTYKNNILSYFLNPIEIPARKFAHNCMEYLTKNQLIANTKETKNLIEYKNATEMEMAGDNLDYLFLSEALWRSDNASNGKEDIVGKYYTEIILHYKKLEKENRKALNRVYENLKEGAWAFKVKELFPTRALALNYDYEKYKNSENKQEFLNRVITANEEAYKFGIVGRTSNLPGFIRAIEMQKMFDEKSN